MSPKNTAIRLAIVAAALGIAYSAGQSTPAALTMWTWKPSHLDGLQKAAANFTTKTGIPVKIQVFAPQEAYQTKLRAAASTGDLPDVFTDNSGANVFKKATAGLFVELTDKLSPEWKRDFYPNAIESSYVSKDLVEGASKDPKSELKGLKPGQVFSVPILAGNACMIFASKTQLKAAGLNPNVAPRTWEQWVSMIQTTKRKDAQNGGVVTGLKNALTGHFWLYRPMSYLYLGAEKFSARENNKLKWTSPESVETLRLYNQLSDLWMPGVLATDIDPADVAFSQGKAAFDIGGSYTLSFLIDQGMTANDLLIFPIPAPSKAAIKELILQPLSLIDAGVSKDSKNKEAAIQWLRYLTSKEGATTFASSAKDLPATMISTDRNVLGDALASIVASFKPGKAFPTYDFSNQPSGQDVNTPAGNALIKLISKEATPQSAAETIQRAYDDAWKAVGK